MSKTAIYISSLLIPRDCSKWTRKSHLCARYSWRHVNTWFWLRNQSFTIWSSSSERASLLFFYGHVHFCSVKVFNAECEHISSSGQNVHQMQQGKQLQARRNKSMCLKGVALLVLATYVSLAKVLQNFNNARHKIDLLTRVLNEEERHNVIVLIKVKTNPQFLGRMPFISSVSSRFSSQCHNYWDCSLLFWC